jgi:hypothetical protein
MGIRGKAIKHQIKDKLVKWMKDKLLRGNYAQQA